MKRLWKIVLACCVILSALPVSALAVDGTFYDMPEIRLSVEIPFGYYVLTRNNADGDRALDIFGTTASDANAFLEENNIYLDAADAGVSREIVVLGQEISDVDYRDLEGADLDHLLTAFEEELENSGYSVLDMDMHEHDQARFLVAHYINPQSERLDYILQYYTVRGEMLYSITMHSYGEDLDEEMTSELRSVVRSANFYSGSSDGAAFSYTDNLTGLRFTVPGGWRETSFDSYESGTVKYIFSEQGFPAIIFESKDVWDEEDTRGRDVSSREEVNNSIFTEADVAELCGCGASQVSRVTLGGEEYFLAEYEREEILFEVSFSFPTTVYLRWENGYRYYFWFDGQRTDSEYPDFESLVVSAVYPRQIENGGGYGGGSGTGTSGVWGSVFSVLFGIAVYTLPVVLFRYIIRRRAVKQGTAVLITLLYGGLVLLLMVFLLAIGKGSLPASAGIALWSIVHYFMLAFGKKTPRRVPVQPAPQPGYGESGAWGPAQRASAETVPMERTEYVPAATAEIIPGRPAEQPTEVLMGEEAMDLQGGVRFCLQCGCRLEKGSHVCPQCGARTSEGAAR